MNINTNLNFSGNNVVSNQEANQTTAVREQNGEPARLSLDNAKAGTMFQGDILDVRGNQVRIQVGTAVLNAMLENQAKVNIGERVSFLVQSNNGSKVTLATLEDGGKQMQNALLKTLDSAMLPATERNLTAVREMMNYGMPVDKNSMAETGKLLAQFQDANVETIIALKSHDLPVTEGNIAQFELYKNAEGKLSDQLQDLVKNLTNMTERAQASGETGKIEQFLSNLKELVNANEGANVKISIQDTGSQSAQAKALQPEAANVQQAAGGENAQAAAAGKNTAVPDMAAKAQPVTENEISGQQSGNVKNENTPVLTAEQAKANLKSLLQDIKSGMEQKFLLTPEQLMKGGDDAVKELYRQMNETVDKMIRLAAHSGQDTSKFANSAGEMKNNMQFMQDFNQLASYVQLPMKLGETSKTGELYVMSRKNRKQDPNSPLTAFLHLDMDHLGTTDVNLSMVQGGKLTTKFKLDNDESVRIVAEHLPELEERLEKLGYSVELSVDEVPRITATPFEQILEADKPAQPVKRFSFDMRA